MTRSKYFVIGCNRSGSALLFEILKNAVLFLSSSLSDYISGQIIGVDGCYSI